MEVLIPYIFAAETSTGATVARGLSTRWALTTVLAKISGDGVLLVVVFELDFLDINQLVRLKEYYIIIVI